MKTIAIHSHKGGVGKTTVALLVAKQAALLGQKVCVIDLDFIGSGIADLFAITALPDEYVESYFLGTDPHSYDLDRLLVNQFMKVRGQLITLFHDAYYAVWLLLIPAIDPVLHEGYHDGIA